MILRPPRSTRTEPLFPDPTLCRSKLSPSRPDSCYQVADAGKGTAFRPDLLRRHQPGGLYARHHQGGVAAVRGVARLSRRRGDRGIGRRLRSEEHTSELQSLMRISYAVFCLNKKKQTHSTNTR